MKNIIKKLALSALILVIPFLFTGCLESVSLNERAIVQAIGIDTDGEDLLLTLQIYSPSSGGGNSVGATLENAKIISCKGKTISQALTNASLLQGKKIFIGHNRVIIVSEELAKKGIDDVLSYFTQNPISRQSSHMLVCENSAKDIISARINQGMLPAQTLEKVVLNSDENGFNTNVLLYRFAADFYNNNASAILPIIKLNQQKSSDKKEESIEEISNISLDGTAIFKEKKLVGKLKKDDTRGLLFLRGEIIKTDFTVKTPQFNLAVVEIYDTKVKLIPKITDQEISFAAKINCKARLNENIKSHDNFNAFAENSTQDLIDLQKNVEMQIKQECENAFNIAVKQNKADVLNFGDAVWREDVKFWRTVEKDWQESVDKINVTVDVFVNIE